MTTLTQEEFKQKYGTNGLEKFGIRQPEKSYLQKFGSNIKDTFVGGAKEIISDISKQKSTAEAISPLGKKPGQLEYTLSGLKTMGDVAGTIAKTTGGIIGSAIEPLLSENAKQKIGDVFKYIDDTIDLIPGMTPDIKKSLGNVFETVTLKGGGKFEKAVERGVTTTTTGVKNMAVGVGEKIASKLPSSLESFASKVPQQIEKIVKWFATEPSEQVKTILKETPTSKFDDYLKVVKESMLDPRKPSVFEKVGDKLSDATKQIKKQADSIGAQKTQILQKAKAGLVNFTEPARTAILKVMRLENNPIKSKVMAELKGIRTKLDADKAIDKIQDMIYDARGTGIIASGSAFEKQLRGILGEMNNALKESLPDSYSVLNMKFAARKRALSTLNKALGEVVEGVPVRGASLIKQFFSPSASKAKELFEFIKKSTGIDLAQDTTVAKFLGEVFEDPKVRSLLEGKIPTSKTGLIKQALDFSIEKSKTIQKLRENFRSAEIQKAKDFTK